MRSYRIVDEEFEDEDGRPSVVPLGDSRGRQPSLLNRATRPEPWTPRDRPIPRAARPDEPPSPEYRPKTSWSYRVILGVFIVISIVMALGIVVGRILADASRAVADLPAEGASAAVTHPPASPAALSTAPSSTVAAPTAPPATPVPTGQGAITTEIRVLEPNYTVAPGDTLAKIARRYGTTIEALASINNLENRNSLSVGQKLIIP
ncbi:MAG: LysM peptidoglycan-binding domain-containing protein [Chloroflexi bacterium]|nr:LysM peptidoglycan-binding domain-containing protein [Chloroflexota bacterium]